MLLRTEAFPVFLSFLKMSQGHVIDIMTFNSYGLQYYSFWKGKIGFGFLKHEERDCFLDNANSHQALQLTVDSF